MRNLILILALHCAAMARADILNLTNGDRYVGSIQLVDAREVQLKSEIVGLLKVPRDKVASIFFGTNRPPVSAVETSVSAKNVESSPRAESKAGFDPKMIEKVQQEFLGGATPEANAMFTDLVQGLASGKLSVEDLRNQARASLKELRELQAEIGEEASNPLFDSYIGILEKFISQPSTNRPAATLPKTPSKPQKSEEDE